LSAKALSAAGQPSLLPQPGKIDEALLKVGGTAYVDGSTVDIGVEGGGTTLPLKVGESVTLIEAAEIIGAPGNNTANGSKLRYGAILSPYEIGLYSENGQMWGTVLSGGNGLNAGSKALSEGFLAGSAFLNRGANFLVDRGFSAAQKAGAQSARDGKGLAGFVAIGGGRLKHDTGSHIDTEGYSVVAGLATTRSLPVGEVTLGAFIEHGEGDYNTTNSFANAARVHGKGDADYTGGGLLARLEFAGNARGHLYTEASAHAGKASLDFTARELRDVLQRSASYDSDSRYASAHAGLGYVFKLGEYSSLDLYGQYLWSRQGSDTVRLSTREEVKFRAVDSQRTRLGARWSHAVGPTGQAYVGAAWEREYDGKAKASAYGLSIAAPDMKGDTGLVEAGFTLAPNATVPLAIDVGVQGYTGKHEGVTGSFKVNYRF
jgi:outer membrane autotransporter protein